jgi:hypothetical protein
MEPADTLIRNITHEGKDASMAVSIKKCDLIFFLKKMELGGTCNEEVDDIRN